MAPWHWCAMPAPSPAASPVRILATAVSNPASPSSIAAKARCAAMPAAAGGPGRSARRGWSRWEDRHAGPFERVARLLRKVDVGFGPGHAALDERDHRLAVAFGEHHHVT